MQRGRRHYDPFVQVAPVPEPVTEPQPIQGLLVEKTGVYLHVADVAASLRQMAEEADAIEQPMTPQETLLAAAASFEAIHEPSA